MTSVVLCSASGAPGVTTAALALVWVWPQVTGGRRVVLVDADPSGSGLLGGALQARVAIETGLLALAADTRAPDVDDLLAHSVALDGDRRRFILPGISDPVQAGSLAPLWASFPDLAIDLHLAETDLVVDVGRLGHRDEPSGLIGDADILTVLQAPTIPATVATAAIVRRLSAARAPRSAPAPVVVGERRPYTVREVERALGVPCHALSLDVRTAEALGSGDGSSGRLDRSLLLRSARSLAESLLAGLPAEVRS